MRNLCVFSRMLLLKKSGDSILSILLSRLMGKSLILLIRLPLFFPCRIVLAKAMFCFVVVSDTGAVEHEVFFLNGDLSNGDTAE